MKRKNFITSHDSVNTLDAISVNEFWNVYREDAISIEEVKLS